MRAALHAHRKWFKQIKTIDIEQNARRKKDLMRGQGMGPGLLDRRALHWWLDVRQLFSGRSSAAVPRNVAAAPF